MTAPSTRLDGGSVDGGQPAIRKLVVVDFQGAEWAHREDEIFVGDAAEVSLSIDGIQRRLPPFDEKVDWWAGLPVITDGDASVHCNFVDAPVGRFAVRAEFRGGLLHSIESSDPTASDLADVPSVSVGWHAWIRWRQACLHSMEMLRSVDASSLGALLLLQGILDRWPRPDSQTRDFYRSLLQQGGPA